MFRFGRVELPSRVWRPALIAVLAFSIGSASVAFGLVVNGVVEGRIVGILVWLAAAGALLFLAFVVVVNAIQITLGRHSPEMVGAAVVGALLMALTVVVVATGRRLPSVAIYAVFGVAVLAGAVRTLVGIAKILTG